MDQSPAPPLTKTSLGAMVDLCRGLRALNEERGAHWTAGLLRNLADLLDRNAAPSH